MIRSTPTHAHARTQHTHTTHARTHTHTHTHTLAHTHTQVLRQLNNDELESDGELIVGMNQIEPTVGLRVKVQNCKLTDDCQNIGYALMLIIFSGIRCDGFSCSAGLGQFHSFRRVVDMLPWLGKMARE